jgi:hypothetical protein
VHRGIGSLEAGGGLLDDRSRHDGIG